MHAPRQIRRLHSDRFAHFGSLARTILFECMRRFLAPEPSARKHMGNLLNAMKNPCRYYDEGFLADYYRRLACEYVAGPRMCSHDSRADAAYRPLLDVSPCVDCTFLLLGVP